MSNTQHTATPYYRPLRSSTVVKGADGYYVAETGFSRRRTPEEAIANAAFIVRACNAHQELVDAVHDADQLVQEIELAFSEVPAGVDAWLAMTRTKVLAALAKLEGE